jgi:hypothetical protein
MCVADPETGFGEKENRFEDGEICCYEVEDALVGDGTGARFIWICG